MPSQVPQSEMGYSGFNTVGRHDLASELNTNNQSQAEGEDGKMQSAQMLVDNDLVTQVYQAYVGLLGRDKNAKVKDILVQEPFFSLLQ